MREVPGLKIFARELTTAAKRGEKTYLAYLASAAFEKRFKAIPPSGRRRAIQVMGEVELLALKHDGLPPPAKPQRRCVPRWNDPAERQRLALAYAQAKGDHEKAARIMGMTVAAVKLAKQRHLDAHATTGAARAA